MPPLPSANAARRNVRPTVTATAPFKPPRLRHLKDHHPETRRFWRAVCASPQAGLFTEATWEWLQAKMWRVDAYYANPVGAQTALARELDDVASKLVLLPRDAIARGFTPQAHDIPGLTDEKPRGAARGRKARKDRLLKAVPDGDAP